MDISKKAIDLHTFDTHVTLRKEELAGYLKTATDALAQQVTIEGFRKGKAPKELVKKQLNPDLIRQEALEYALEDSFTKVTQQEQWDVQKTSDLKILKNDSDTLEYSLRVAVWPAVQLPDLATIRVSRQKLNVTDAEIEESLDTVRNMRATFLDKAGPAAKGDRVEIDFDATMAGKLIEGGQSRNHPLIIGGKNFMPGFEEELIGLTAGQTRAFSLVAPDNYFEATLAGKKVDFSVTMNRVQSVLKPAADDAFAKTLGRFENLDQLRGNLREGLYNEKLQKERQRVRLAILDEIIDASKVPAPDDMVKEELDGMVQRFADDLRSRGMDITMYLTRLKKGEDELRKDWRKEAERQVCIMLVLRQAAKAKNIAVTPEELDQAFKETVTELMRTGQLQEGQIDPERIKSALAQRILTDKTLEFLEGVCAVDEA